MAGTEDVRRLLAGVREGRDDDKAKLFELVYQDLRRIARAHLRGQQTGTLGTTAIVNEAYLRLAGPGAGPWSRTRSPGFAPRLWKRRVAAAFWDTARSSRPSAS
jgi:hypothetical protein